MMAEQPREQPSDDAFSGAGTDESPCQRPRNISLQKQLDDELTCNVCLDQFTDPKALPCLHCFCLNCIKLLPKHEKGSNFVLDCPLCRKSHEMPSNGIDTLPDAFHINKLFELQREIASNTPITPMSPLAPPGDKCLEHNDLLRVFCNTCNKAVCRDCTVTQTHRNHDYHLISDLFPLMKQKVLSKATGCHEKVELVKPSIGVVLDRGNNIRCKGEEIKKQVSECTETIIGKLKAAEMILHREVEEMVDTKCKWLTAQHKDICNAVEELERISATAEDLLQDDRQIQALTRKKRILQQFDEVEKRIDGLVLTPVEDADIEFSADNVRYGVGEVNSTFLYSQCEVKLSGTSTTPWIAGVTNTFTLHISTGKPNIGSIPTCLLDITIQSFEQQQCLKPAVIVTNQSEYIVKFKPQVPGNHSIKVFVCNQQISGSPIPFIVSYSPNLKHRRHIAVPKLIKPHGCVTVDANTLAVAEYGAHCITFLDNQGNRIKSFGTKGTNPGQFTHPKGVALSSDHKTLLVTDDHRLQQLTFDGEVIAMVGGAKHGPSRHEFYSPTGIAVNASNGNIYVADTDNNRIQVLNDNLQVLMSFGRSSVVTERLQGPYDVAIDNGGDVYVADSWNHCIKRFTAKGRLVSQISSHGAVCGKLNWPTSLAFNSYEYLYITEQDNKRVSVFSKGGEVVSCAEFGFGGPQFVFVDDRGNVYISDTYSHKLHIFYA